MVVGVLSYLGNSKKKENNLELVASRMMLATQALHCFYVI